MATARPCGGDGEAAASCTVGCGHDGQSVPGAAAVVPAGTASAGVVGRTSGPYSPCSEGCS